MGPWTDLDREIFRKEDDVKIHPKILQARIEALEKENLVMIALLSAIADGHNTAADAKAFITKMLRQIAPVANDG